MWGGVYRNGLVAVCMWRHVPSRGNSHPDSRQKNSPQAAETYENTVVSRQAASSGHLFFGIFKLYVVLQNRSLSSLHPFSWSFCNGCVHVEVNDISRGLEDSRIWILVWTVCRRDAETCFLICSRASVEPLSMRIPQSLKYQRFLPKEVIYFLFELPKWCRFILHRTREVSDYFSSCAAQFNVLSNEFPVWMASDLQST